jgi:AsmA family/AsmA-like C-terminal region
VKIFSSKRRVIAAAALIVLALFLLRPGASRLKSRIVLSISSAVGRPVDIGSVHLRLLPRPGFDLENLVVYEDPAFGAEPMLRAGEVTATLRLTSLVRGRLEIGRLDITEPSLNLVRGQNGRWNLEALVERTQHTPLAPTAKAKLEPRPAFPYIQATSARINFKIGPEKKPYALINADFSLWQDSENTWGVRLKAQPFRTDLNLNDTGLLRVNGTWQRAATLRETPLEFSLEWSRSQLGQVSKFFTGNDQGWRGEVQVEVALSGTPAKLQIASDVSIQDFRRYDITAGQPLLLTAHCDGQYSSLDRTFQALACDAPVGSGRITLVGVAGLPTSSYKLDVTAENVPMRPVIGLAQRTKKNLAEDLAASGTVQATIAVEKGASGVLRLEGQGEIDDFRLASARNQAEIARQTLPFVWTSGNSAKGSSTRPIRKNLPGMHLPDGPHFEFGPVLLGSRGATSGANGWANRAGYSISLTGETEVASTLRLARMLGIPDLQAAPEGNAQLDLQIAGSWGGWGNRGASDFAGPQVTGSAKLRDVQIAVRGVGGPIEISSADMQLSADMVRVNKLNAKAAGASWNGSLEMPRGCGTPTACEVHFNLTANQIVPGELRDWASPPLADQPWYGLLGAGAPQGPSFLASVRANGRLATDHLQMRNFTANHVSANLTLNHGNLVIADLNAEFLGSRHRGAWHADFSVKPAACEGTGNFSGITLARLAGAASDTSADTANPPWITGAANATYQVKGICGTEFWQTVEGTLQFDVRDGTLPHISLAEDEGPLKITRLVGQSRLREGKLEMKDAKLDSAGGKFQLSGTASWHSDLNLKLAPLPGGTAAGFTITGTLAEPRVTPLPGAEQARLKPEAPK